MLSSVLRNSLSGVSVASSAIWTASNNLANSQTDGFRASRVVLADQPPGQVAQGIGAVGSGVQIVAVEVDTSQGSIALSNEPLQMAVEGDAASGTPNFDNPQTSKIIGGARELSNTEMSREFVNLIQFGTMFRANLQVMETTDELLETLYGLRRF